jgi:hypothetical protein
MANKPKKSVSKHTSARKQPFDSLPEPFDRELLFRFDRVDFDSQWDFSAINTEDLRDLLERLKSLSNNKVKEIFGENGAGKHYAELGSGFNPLAKKRLVLKYDGLDHIHRIRISGTKRFYGILEGNVFSIVWWDPNHEIWPGNRN